MFSSPFTFLRRTSSQYEAALWMFLSGILFTAHVALGKLLSGSYEPGLLAFYRSVIALVWVAPLLMRMPLSKFKTKHAGLIVIRSLFGTAGFLLAFYAYSQEFGIPLSQFNAISFSRSLFIVILAYFLLKEQVGPRRWMATAIGFIGVLIMVRPSADMEIGSILALGSALCFGGAIILVKTLSRFHSPLVLLTYANLLSAILTLPVAIMQWENPHSLADVGLALLVVYFFWTRMAQLIYALSTFTLHETVPEFLTFMVATPEGHAMALTGTVVGALIGVIAFSLVVVSAPMLLDQKSDVFIATVTSVRTVAKNPAPMLLWAAIIAALTALGIATAFLGLIIVFPVIGLASWRAY